MDDGYEDKAVRMEEAHASRGGGSRRPKSGGGGGNAPNRDVLISKALSALLRHQAANAGIELDGEGFARLDKVLQWNRLRSLKATLEDVKAGVADNAKQRFSMKPNPAASISNSNENSTNAADWLIRANQGHSLRVANEGLHTPITLEAANIPDMIVHGTYFAFWPQIEASGGLRKMGRTHVHFGTGLPDGGGKAQVHDDADENTATASAPSRVISGMRSDAEVLVFVDVEKSLRDDPDTKWWLSENGVVLTEGNADGVVPTQYFKEVRGRRQGVGELWRDGQKVADLPEGVVARVPQGKRGQGGGGGGRGGRRGGRGGKRGGR